MWATQRRLMTTLSVLALVALFATAAAPNARAAPTTGATASAAANTCGANPSPPTSAPTIQIYNPLANQRVASPIRVVGLAIAAEARFGITLYDQNGAELAAITATTTQGSTLSPFDARVPYQVATPQDGCLWLYNVSGADGSKLNIVQVPVRLTQVVKACFREVGDTCIEDPFREYWEQQGGLYQFGYPLAPGFPEVAADGKTYWVQYFERARFEWHPENPAPYDVLLGLLGNEITTTRRTVREAPFLARPRPAGCAATAETCATVTNSLWFAATGHHLGFAAGHDAASNMAGREIAQRWQSQGALPVYGYPISEVFAELGYDGDLHYVQYFERHRLEYHPLNPAPYDIQLGQLGRQIYVAKYGVR